MAKLELTNKQLKSIIDKFDTDRIDFDGKLKQTFEIEDTFVTHTCKSVDLNVSVELTQTNSTIEVDRITFELEGFYNAIAEGLGLVYDDGYLSALEDDVKNDINCF